MTVASAEHESPRWLHRWAVCTAGATLVLLALGSLVTTRRAGMADPVWPTYPWHLLLTSWEEPRPGFLIEHTHRLAGYIVGCCAIVLAVGLWSRESRRWLRWLGVVALLGVTAQGLLGGFRVLLDRWLGTDLAMVHGSFASLVFSLLASIALFTSPGWAAEEPAWADAGAARLRRWSPLPVGLVFAQIVLGAVLRHTYSSLGQRGHVLVAFAVVAGVVWLVKEVWDCPHRDRALTLSAALLAIFVTLQVLFGVEALMFRTVASASAGAQILVRTAHVLMGHLVLAAAVIVTLQVYRRTAAAVQPAPDPVGRLEGVA